MCILQKKTFYSVKQWAFLAIVYLYSYVYANMILYLLLFLNSCFINAGAFILISKMAIDRTGVVPVQYNR